MLILHDLRSVYSKGGAESDMIYTDDMGSYSGRYHLRLELAVMIVFALVASFIVVIISISSASTVSTTKTTMQAFYGMSNNIVNNFLAETQGFSVISPSSGATSQPCTWITGGTCQTSLTKNDYQYAVILIVNTPPSLLTTYTVTMKWDLGHGSGLVQVGSLKVSVPVTTAGQSMTFVFDTGSNTYSDPRSIQINVS